MIVVAAAACVSANHVGDGHADRLTVQAAVADEVDGLQATREKRLRVLSLKSAVPVR